MAEIIYDSNNWLRRQFETGGSVRNCYSFVRGQPGIVVFDGKNAKARRKALYPAYKARRQSQPSSLYAQFDLFRETMQWLNVPLVCVPGWEADDVIATLVRSEPQSEFLIKSTDVDFLQLPNAKIERTAPPPCPPQELRLYKTLVGDASDNIPGFKGFGKGAWAKLTPVDKESLTDFLEGKEQYYPENLPTATKNWLDDNRDQARVFWKIVDLMDVPMSEITAHTTVGVLAPEKLEEQLKRFML